MEAWLPKIFCASFIAVFLFAWYKDWQRDKKEKAMRKAEALARMGHRWTHVE